MSYNIIYLKGAIDDLKAIASHYGQINTNLLTRLDTALESAEIKLLRNPFSFTRIDYMNFRRILLGRFPCKVI